MPPLRAAVLCPHCEEATLPNALADGSVVCSCAAERPLPPGLVQPEAPTGPGHLAPAGPGG
jgi:hypothetical protein